MNFRESAALDAYITGNYGEDQFRRSGADWLTRAQRKALSHLTGDWQTHRQLHATIGTLDKLVRAGEAQSKANAGVVWYRLSGIESDAEAR